MRSAASSDPALARASAAAASAAAPPNGGLVPAVRRETMPPVCPLLPGRPAVDFAKVLATDPASARATASPAPTRLL
eukprot:scaffold97509_cov31-Tisochrysis_lutea.AAC.1